MIHETGRGRRLGLALALLLVSSLVFAGGGQQADSNTYVFATDATWPPMEFIDESTRELVGYDIDLANEIAKAAGFDIRFEVVAWDGIFAGLGNGQYDAVISSVTITEERSERFDFSSPYLNAGQVLVVPNASADSTKLADLVGQNVGAQIGTAGGFEVQKYPGINLKEYPEIGLALNDLVNGNLAGAVLDLPVAADYALQNPSFRGKIKIVGELMTSEELGIVVRKGNAELLDLVNKGLATIISNGRLTEIKAKWGLK